MNYQKVKEAITICNKDNSFESIHKDLSGFSGTKLVSTLQSLTKLASEESSNNIYLEVGVFQGLTLTSVASYNPEVDCFGIDNFSQFDKDGNNQALVKDRFDKFTEGNANLINMDFEDALLNLKSHIGDRKVAVYFIDGPHDYRSQYLCLDYIKPHLSENAVILIDDSNYAHVRRANHDWLRANQDFTLIFEEYTRIHPQHMDKKEEAEVRNGWWDGVNIIIKDQSQKSPRELPKVEDDLQIYYDDHLVHSAKYSRYAYKILRAFSFGLLPALAFTLFFFITPRNKKKEFRSGNIK